MSDANDNELNYAHKDVDDGDDDVFAIDEDASSDDEQEKKSEKKNTPILHDFINLNEASAGASVKSSPAVAAKSPTTKSTISSSTPPTTPTLSKPTASATSPGDDADADDDDDDKAAAEAAQFDPYRMANAGKKKKKKKESILERLDRLKRERAREQRVVGNSNVVELEESAEQRLLWLELDVQLFSDPARMAEGVVLQDPLEAFGKVVFSLANIPLNVGFQTERGTSVVRINDDEVVLNGRRVVAVPRDEVVKQREQDAAIADRKRAEDERERLEREQLMTAIAERIDFRATVAESKKSKRFIPGYRILVESKRDGSTRTVSKRFDDFLTFHRRLLVKLSLAQQTKLPKFPRRQRLVAGADAIEARRVALDRYLSELLTCDIVLVFEAELREFVMHDGEAWRAAMSDSDKSDNDDDNKINDKSLRRKPTPKAAAAKPTSPTAEDTANQFLSESDDEVDSTPVVREVRKKRKSTRERVKGHLKRLGSKSSTATSNAADSSTSAAAAVTSDRAEGVDQAEAVDYLRDADDDDNDDMDVEGKQASPRVEVKPAVVAGAAVADGDSSGDENGVPLPKVSFGGRTVRKQRKQSDTFAHAYVEVRDATGLPPKTQAYVALGVVDVGSALGLPSVQASSGGSTTVRVSAVSLEQQSAHPAPGLSKLRVASTTIGKLEADGVAFACEWRESFRVNISDPEGQALVVSLCAKNMLKDTRLVSVAIPLRATERTWWVAKVAGEAGGSVSPRAGPRAIEIDGVERWIPLAFPGAPEARVRVVLAFREAVEFSAPREFRHEAHMGFSSDGSFDVRNLPVAWKGFFKSIGIKPRELADPVTAKMVFKIIAKHKEAQQSGEAVTADDLLVDIDFADLRPTGPAPAPPIASLLDGFDPFAPLTPEQAPDPDRVIFVDDESSSEHAPVDEKPAPVVVKKVKTVLDTSSEEEEEDVVEDDNDDEDQVQRDDAEDVADAMTDDDEAADDAPASPIKDAGGDDDDDDAAVVAAPVKAAGGPPPPPPPMPKGGAKAKKIATDADTAAPKKESTEKLKRAAPSARDMTMDSIRKGNLKAALKPATDRELAPKSQAGSGPVQLGDILKIAMSRRRDALKVDKTGAAVEPGASTEAATTTTTSATTDNGEDNWDDV